MKPGLALAAILAPLVISGCQTVPEPAAQGPATFANAVASDDMRIDRQSLAIGLGAYIDRRLAHDLAPDDQVLHDGAAAKALWDKTKGYGVDWRNRATGASGTIEPSSRVESRSGKLCRHFHDTVRLPGEAVLGVDGTACFDGHDWTVDF